MLEKIQELFQICDSDDKGYITRTDMKKLHGEMPLTAEELENVFNSLDSDKNGCLTLEEFSLGFSDFLYGRKLSQAQDQMADLSQNVPEVLYQDEPQAGIEDEEEKHFSLLMERLDACSVFKDYSEVRSLWAQLQKDEPHLLSNFEEFLAQVTSQIRQERKEMEDALRIKAATHDGEIRQLYEEMEQQINTEKDQLLLKGSERIQQWSQDLEQQLSCKEQELEQLGLRHRRLEKQCQELHSEHQESRVENNKLKMTNEELSHELENTCHELSLAQEQLAILEEQAVRLQQEREMEIYRITEGLQREKQSLIKQLDLLREINKHLRDERDISSMKSNLFKKITHSQRPAVITPIKNSGKNQDTAREMSTEEVTQPSSRKPSSLLNVRTSHLGARAEGKTRIADCTSNAGWAPATMSPGVDVTVAPPEGWPLRRVISIEEDHLPNLLQEDPHLLLHQLAEEEEKGGQEEAQTDLEMYSSDMFLACADSAPLARGKMHFSEQKGGEGTVPNLARGQPVGKESLQKGPVEDAVGLRECIFKVIFVGNSSVGKTALLRRFCDGRFHPTMVTVGIDYCMHSLNLGDSLVRLQLWDTAGQERYRSITQQFFRKADGVVVIYDVTTHDSFSSVHCWLDSIEEEVRGPIPIMLLGNKSDKEIMREVPTKVGEQLAQETGLMFYECSAYTGHNVMEAMLHLARVMREQEDRVWESTVLLVDKPMKRKACCN
ncbi:ras and EF-hand domain-containing protein homolog isoform X2 [Electrophorus electricus]|uniref:ras and EF-hand domain-containing protein homolog isoform X2 n=1 Tax=Electrophorus electricus TaxID=8005 RepID=UPI0015CFFF2D|nr:ras and EF-hand domain-containing protein homolog isoform X2 [Electrophorus electricus]